MCTNAKMAIIALSDVVPQSSRVSCVSRLVSARDQGWIAFIHNFLSDGVPCGDPRVKCHLDWKFFSQRNASACIPT